MKEELLNLRFTEMAKIIEEYLDQNYSLESDSDDEEAQQAGNGKVKEWWEEVPYKPSVPKVVKVVKDTLTSIARVVSIMLKMWSNCRTAQKEKPKKKSKLF